MRRCSRPLLTALLTAVVILHVLFLLRVSHTGMRDTEGRPCPPTARVTTLRNESSEVVRLKREIARMSVERQRLQSFPPTARVTPLRNESSEVIRLKRAIASMSIERQRLQALLSAMARISKGDAANETRGGGRQGAADAGLPVCSNTFIGDGYCLQRRPTEAQTEWAHIEEKWDGIARRTVQGLATAPPCSKTIGSS